MGAPSGGWNCTFCEDPGCIEEQAPKEFVMSGGTKRKAPTGLSEKELKVCERVLLELFCHSASTAFHEPVSKAVPNYYRIITHPMDFTTIKCKLSRQHFNHYNEVEHFISDVKLVFKNCSLYNSDSSEVGKAGKTMEGFFHELVKNYLPCYTSLLYRELSIHDTTLSSESASKRSRPDDATSATSPSPVL